MRKRISVCYRTEMGRKTVYMSKGARKLTRDEKSAIQQSGRFWKDWMYLKDSESADYFIAVNRFHPTQTKRFRRIT